MASASKQKISRRPTVPHHRGAPIRLPRHAGSPDPADLHAVREWVHLDDPRPTAIDLFCGAGGLSLGLSQSGFRMLVGADSDQWAVDTHDANLDSLGWCGDLSTPQHFLQTLEVWGITSVDLVAGGVPCQPFSRAGKSRIRDLIASGEREGHDSRADLWESFMEIVAALKPRAVLVENVPDLPSWDEGAVLTGFYESLRSLGYRVDARVLEAWRYGVPQHRQRLILVGLAGGRTMSWPKSTGHRVTLEDAIRDLPIIPAAQRSERLVYPDAPETPFQRRMRSGIPKRERHVIWDHICRDVRDDDRQAFEVLPQGGTYLDVPKELRRYRDDIFTDKYRRLAWAELSRSITAHIAKDGYWYIHPEQHRTLSIREAARLQTFPDWFRFAGTQTHRYRQIGNAVPPALGAAVGASLADALSGTQPSGVDPHEEFRKELLAWHAETAAPTLPWRRTGDPWLTLAAELTGQRARRRDALALYDVLVELAPNPRAVVANSQSITDRLAALGLGTRAGLVIQLAEALVRNHGGEIPANELTLRSLPGVGDYVAQAALCFGFGRRASLVDASTMRICSRIYGRTERRRFQLRLDLHRLAGPEGPDPEFNAALLELGLAICVPEQPKCSRCPVRSHCTLGAQSEPDPQLTLEKA